MILKNKFFIKQDVYCSTSDRMVEIKDIQEFWEDPSKLIYQTSGGAFYTEDQLHESKEEYASQRNGVKVGDCVYFFTEVPTDKIVLRYGSISRQERAGFWEIQDALGRTLITSFARVFKSKELALKSLEE